MVAKRSGGQGVAHGTPARPRRFPQCKAGLRIGLLGGTFDPVHSGHLGMAEDAMAAFGLDRVVFLPSAVTPHKRHRQAASAEHRLAMLRLAVADHPRMEVSTVELDRGGVSFTVDTMTDLRALHPGWDLWFIVGMDSLRELHTWRRVGELLDLCTIATLERPGADRPLAAVPGFPPEVSRRLLGQVAAGRRLDISSSGIRSRIAERRPIRYLVPPAVETYIRAHRLYEAGRPEPTPAQETPH